jgi:lysophospholipase L1-like esterase
MEFHDEFDPDLVIAVTGWNDMYVLTTGVDPDMQMRTESRALARAVEESLKPMSTMHAIRKVAGSLGIWRLVVHFREKIRLANPISTTVSYDADHAARIIPGMADRYATMANFAERHGSRLMIAVQPDIYTTGKPLTTEEKSVLNRYLEKHIGMDETYPRYRADYLRNLRQAMASQGVEVVDMGGVFDHLSDPVFIDDCHFNDRGYRQIAEFLNVRVSGDYLPTTP